MSNQDVNLNSVDAQFSKVLTELEGIRKTLDERLPKLEERVTSLERWKWWASGASAVVGFLISKLL